MQNTIFEPENLPEIANPSLVDQLLFESSTLTSIGLLVITVVVSLVLLKYAKSKPAAIVLISGLLASAGVFIAGKSVVTSREHITMRLESLVDAVAEADSEALSDLLHESVRVRTRFGGANSRAELIRLATSRAAPAIDQIQTTETRVGLSGSRVARSLVKVKADSDGPMGSSWWMIDWSRPDEQTSSWVATHIEPVWIQGMKNPAGL